MSLFLVKILYRVVFSRAFSVVESGPVIGEPSAELFSGHDWIVECCLICIVAWEPGCLENAQVVVTIFLETVSDIIWNLIYLFHNLVILFVFMKQLQKFFKFVISSCITIKSFLPQIFDESSVLVPIVLLEILFVPISSHFYKSIFSINY